MSETQRPAQCGDKSQPATPRTDAALKAWQEAFDPHYDAVAADFARQLERELAQAIAACEDAQGLARTYKEIAEHANAVSEKALAQLEHTPRSAEAATFALTSPEPTEEMADAVRGVLQILRGKRGATFLDVYEHCRSRGDDVRKWPQWARDAEGYVTETAAACLVYELMRAHAPSTPPSSAAPTSDAAMLENYARSYDGMEQVSGGSVAYDIRHNMIPALGSMRSATERSAAETNTLTQAAAYLEVAAETGITSHINGIATPNSVHCQRIADEIKALIDSAGHTTKDAS
jgi:hypothetical protein